MKAQGEGEKFKDKGSGFIVSFQESLGRRRNIKSSLRFVVQDRSKRRG